MSFLRKITKLLEKSEIKSIAFLLLLIVIGAFFELLGVGLIIPVVGILVDSDFYLNHPEATRHIAGVLGYLPAQKDLITFSMLFLMFVYVFKAVYLSLLSWKQSKIMTGFVAIHSNRLLNLYLNRSYTFHLQSHTSTLVRNVIGEVDQLINNVIVPLITLFSELLVITFITILLFVVEPIGTMIVIILFMTTSLGYYFIVKKYTLKLGKSRQVYDAEKLKHLKQSLDGIKEVKLRSAEEYFKNQYSEPNVKGANVSMMQTVILHLPKYWLESLSIINIIILILYLISSGKSVESIMPTLGVFGLAAFRLLPSVNKILGMAQQLNFSLPVLDVIGDEYAQKNNYPERSNEDIKFSRIIKFNNVSYTYPGSDAITIKNVSLNIKYGESVAIIGKTGSGKSTLVDLILGLISPTQGSILIDDYDISENVTSWQKKIGYVSQNIYLVDGTIQANIAFGVQDIEIDKEKLNKAINLAGLNDYINGLDEGINAIVGESGKRISGGQKQRIGIARALYHSPEILIFDEASSALDLKTEKEIMDNIFSIKSVDTIIFITHKYDYLDRFDSVIKIDKGGVDRISQPNNYKAIGLK